jgi:hypothetical protein
MLLSRPLNDTKGWFALALLIHAIFSVAGFAQQVAAEQLKEFEGRYEYLSGGSIDFGASPRDGIFYAFLDDARYPLKTIANGVFADRDGSRVAFERGTSGQISGYRFHQRNATNFFRRLADANLPETMWFARRAPGNAAYQFTVPTRQT